MRFHLLPAARLAANLDIICIHVSGAYLFGGMGLPLFFLLTFALAARRKTPKPFLENAKARFARLMGPWLFWSVVHWLAVFAAYGRGEPGVYPIILDTPLWVTLTYLWFLPFIWVMEVLANPVLHACRRVPNRVFIPAALLLGLATVYLLLGYIKVHPVQHRVVGWWLFGTPLIFFGAAIGRMLSIRDKSRRARVLLIALLLCGWWYYKRGQFWQYGMDLKGFAQYVLGADDPGRVMGMLHWNMTRYVLAMAILLAALQWPARNIRPLTYLGTLTIGIYMLHFGVWKFDDLLAWLAVRLPGVPESAYYSGMLRFVLVWVTTGDAGGRAQAGAGIQTLRVAAAVGWDGCRLSGR